MSTKPLKRGRLLALLYVLAVLAWLLVCGGTAVRDAAWARSGVLQQQELSLADFATSGIRMRGQEGLFTTTDPDPQLIYTPAPGTRVVRFTFRGQPLNRGIGEMAVYYTRTESEPYSEARKVWAQQDAAGNWVFELGGRSIYALRFDPDSVGGILWQAEGFTLNAPKPLAAYFVPSLLQLFALLLGPPLAWGLVCESTAFLRPLLVRRRFEARWRAMEEEQE